MDEFSSGGTRIRIEAHEPPLTAPVPSPAVLLLHGSGGAAPYWLRQFAPLLAGRGLAMYAPHFFDKTGTTRATREMILDREHFPLWLEAVKDAVNFVIARPRVDGARVAVLGVSLGAYLATALATHDRRLKAVIELSGGIPHGWEQQVSPAMAPVLLLHGEQDVVVPVTEAYKAKSLLDAAGVPATLEIFPSEGHWFSPRGQMGLLLACGQFPSAHLGPAPGR